MAIRVNDGKELGGSLLVHAGAHERPESDELVPRQQQRLPQLRRRRLLPVRRPARCTAVNRVCVAWARAGLPPRLRRIVVDDAAVTVFELSAPRATLDGPPLRLTVALQGGPPRPTSWVLPAGERVLCAPHCRTFSIKVGGGACEVVAA